MGEQPTGEGAGTGAAGAEGITPPAAEAGAGATTAPPLPAFKAPQSEDELAWLIRDRVERAATAAKEDAIKKTREQIEQQAAKKAAEQSGEYQKLYEAEQATTTSLRDEIAKLNATIADRDRAALRDKVAAKHNLPADLWDRMLGDDEKTMEEDAKRLVAALQLKAPNTEGGSGGSRKAAAKPGAFGNYQFGGQTKIVPFPEHIESVSTGKET